jgi:hypothetical protein
MQEKYKKINKFICTEIIGTTFNGSEIICNKIFNERGNL